MLVFDFLQEFYNIVAYAIAVVKLSLLFIQ